MASDSRALTLKLLADVADFQKKMDQSEKTTEGFSGKLGEFGQKAAAAFAVAGAAAAAYAGKLLVDGVKSAIEDEKAQAALAATLKNVTSATDAQIAATEDYITKTSLAFGVTDEELRPSLQRLAIATGDVTKAQNLQNLEKSFIKNLNFPMNDDALILSTSFCILATYFKKIIFMDVLTF